jgi:hypothetical protein
MRFYLHIIEKVKAYGRIERCRVSLILVDISPKFTRSSDRAV